MTAKPKATAGPDSASPLAKASAQPSQSTALTDPQPPDKKPIESPGKEEPEARTAEARTAEAKTAESKTAEHRPPPPLEVAGIKLTASSVRIAQELQQSTGIDIFRYYKPEIVGRLAELTGVLLLLPLFLKWAFGCLVLGWVLWGLLIVWPFGLWLSIAMFFYTTVASIVVGGCAGVRAVAARLLSNVAGILDLSIGIVENATKDIGDLCSKRGWQQYSLPSFADLFRAAVYCVVLPSLDAVILKKFGFLGRGIAYVIDKTVARAAVGLVLFVQQSITGTHCKAELTADKGEDASGEKNAAVRTLHGLSRQIGVARDYISRVTFRVRWLALLPFNAVFFLLTLVAVAPLLWIYATLTAP